MLSVKIDEINGIAILEPDGALSEDDFKSAANVIDPWIEKNSGLNGLIIHVEHFPGWDSFSALLSHLKFVKEHHKKIPRVAFSTDAIIADLIETIGKHFVQAEIKVFSFKEFESAKAWVAGNT